MRLFLNLSSSVSDDLRMWKAKMVIIGRGGGSKEVQVYFQPLKDIMVVLFFQQRFYFMYGYICSLHIYIYI